MSRSRVLRQHRRLLGCCFRPGDAEVLLLRRRMLLLLSAGGGENPVVVHLLGMPGMEFIAEDLIGDIGEGVFEQ